MIDNVKAENDMTRPLNDEMAEKLMEEQTAHYLEAVEEELTDGYQSE